MDVSIRIQNIMADMLDMASDQIGSGTTKTTTSTWDSLAQINVATALEEEFGVTFSIEEIEAMTSFDEIVGIVTRKV